MMMFKKWFGFALLTFGLAGCSSSITPPMPLNHVNTVSAHYDHLGSININQFVDARPHSQETDYSTSGQMLPLGSGIVYSGHTLPSVPVYLQQALSQEAAQTGIFTVINKPGRYTMTGTITSLAVSYKDTPINLPITLNGNSTPISLGGYPSFTAKVKYHVDIYQGEQRVFSKTIEENKKVKIYTDQSGISAQDISSQAASLLDQTVTLSIKDLFNSITAAGL